ncbi:MAG: marine proteobacterial sortase target protein [Burkholderiaceae bacterium]|nr:marine proteobacterial sortase target protein [Burkholderiaceae bacterium]
MNTSHKPRSAGPRAWLEWALMLGYALASALAISLAMMIAVVLTTSMAGAQTPAVPPPGLTLQTTHGPVVAPLQSTRARLVVTGVTVRAQVTQTFANPTDDWLEGSYLFPLPDDAAVDRLRMRVGERTIEGQVREKQDAQRQFEQARTQGLHASLVDQERPNVFTTRVTNIAPRAVVTVEIEYQQPLALKDGVWRLRFASVVGPRYLNHTADARRLDSPVPLPVAAGAARDLNPLALSVELDAGVPVSVPRSASHRFVVTSHDDTRHRMTLEGAVADRDVEIEWQPLARGGAHAALRTQEHQGNHYALLLVTPPAPDSAALTRLPRETTFIVDTSGSMSGSSIEQARRALVFGIERLQAGDLFNVIEFNSQHRALYPVPRRFDEASRQEAVRFAHALRSQGGTEMRGALEQALGAPVAPGRVRQIVFMTDGAVGYEDEMLRLIEQRIGERRLFTIGIGSAPNSWFMRKAAELGRGTFTHVGRIEEVERKMAEVFTKLSQPLLTDIALRFEGAQPLEPIPAIGDLYAGEPIVIRTRFDRPPQAAVLSGRRGADPWQARVVPASAPAAGLPALWARAQVEALNDAVRGQRMTGQPIDTLKARIVELGLAHQLVTPYTSLVAVDVTPARPADAALLGGKVPTRLPAGWEHESVFGEGELAQGATSAGLQMLIGALLLALALGLALPRGLPAWRKAAS